MPHLIDNATYQFAGITVTTLQIIIIGVSVALMLVLDFLIRKTSFGMAMRAIASDRATVSLLGVPANQVIAVTFALGAALGGAAGLLYGMAYPVVSAAMGITVGWKAFVAAVIGGIGNMRGAVLGAFLLGGVEVMTVAVLPSTYRDLISYSLLLLILVFKPHGLLGKSTIHKA
jgi:branched-chain amino acid transport system permease protein